MNPNEASLAVDLHNPHCAWAMSCDAARREDAVTVWVRGQAWHEDAYLTAQEMADKLRALWQSPTGLTAPGLRRILAALNGDFAVVIRAGGEVIAAVDRLRSIPLFYGLSRQRFLLSDDAWRVRSFVGDRELDPDTATEFLLTGYVTGSDTLYRNLKQIRSGEMIRVEDVGTIRITRERYYRYFHLDSREEPEEELRRAMGEMFERVFDRFCRSLRGKRIVVPLSGGFDSRMIVTALKQAGMRDVVCFSYGAPGNRESALSREVARRLGFEWHFVPYSRRRWRAWFNSRDGLAYRRYAEGACSLAHLQDWPAVRELLAAGVLARGDEIAPGHSPIGQHIPSNWATMGSLTDVVDGILDFHYALWKWAPGVNGLRDLLESRLLASLEVDAVRGPIEAGSASELWEVEERQSKFIVNSVRAYEFLGCGWRLPLCDNDVWGFDATLPLRFRAGRALYQAYLQNVLFPKLGVGDVPMNKPPSANLIPREKLPKPLLGLCRDLRRVWTLAPDTRRGSFTVADRLKAWLCYLRRFGNGGRSIERLFEVNTLAGAHTLRELNDHATGPGLGRSRENQPSHTAVARSSA